MRADGILDVPVPRTVEDLRIPIPLIHDLVLRQTMSDGRSSTVALSKKLSIGPVVMTKVVEELRELRYLEVQGLEGRDYLLALTDAGRVQAADRMQLCRYIGPAPVCLEDYTRVIHSQHAEPKINLEALRDAFSDLVISDRLLREVGPAAIAGGAMFLYGPPGTGKTSIAERLLRIYGDRVLVPVAVEVDGQIISVFDPVVHQPLDPQPADIDPRWMVCKRPFIIVGGELTRNQLDLAYQRGSGTYLAPLQMQANNGVLVIDDFGRQTMTPQELLNRWIVPLDRQRDYLSLDYGVKFEVPFDAKIVFSTNLKPHTLGDEAFFRRIQSKILIPTISDDQFEEVLRRVAEAKAVTVSPDAPTHLRWMSRELGDGDLRPYLPGSIIKILEAICTFEERELVLDPTMIERIANMYFTHSDEQSEADFVMPGMMPGAAVPGMVSMAGGTQQFTVQQLAGMALGAETLPPMAPLGDQPKAAAPSIFSASAPERPKAQTERDWRSVAAKAVAAYRDDEPDAPSGDGNGNGTVPDPAGSGSDTAQEAETDNCVEAETDARTDAPRGQAAPVPATDDAPGAQEAF